MGMTHDVSLLFREGWDNESFFSTKIYELLRLVLSPQT